MACGPEPLVEALSRANGTATLQPVEPYLKKPAPVPRVCDGQGTDTIYDGLRNDTVFLDKDATSDTVHCGPGHDVIYGATPGENTIAADCEVHVVLPTTGACPPPPKTEPPGPIVETGRCLRQAIRFYAS
jgi:hypothetical protein